MVEVYRDYQRMCDLNPLFCRYPFEQYLHVRLMIGRWSRRVRLSA